MRKISPKNAKLANIFGGLGYLSVIFQWLWTVLILLPSILNNQMVKDFITPTPASGQAASMPRFDGDSIIIMGIAIIFTVAILALTVFILIRLPFKLVEASKKTVDTTVRTTIPIVTHHKQITQKEQRELSYKLKIIVKLILILLPLGMLISVFFISVPLESAIIFLIGGFFAITSLIWFIMQYFIGRIVGNKHQQLI